jgi:hypothetical protein
VIADKDWDLFRLISSGLKAIVGPSHLQVSLLLIKWSKPPLIRFTVRAPGIMGSQFTAILILLILILILNLIEARQSSAAVRRSTDGFLRSALSPLRGFWHWKSPSRVA